MEKEIKKNSVNSKSSRAVEGMFLYLLNNYEGKVDL